MRVLALRWFVAGFGLFHVAALQFIGMAVAVLGSLVILQWLADLLYLGWLARLMIAGAMPGLFAGFVLAARRVDDGEPFSWVVVGEAWEGRGGRAMLELGVTWIVLSNLAVRLGMRAGGVELGDVIIFLVVYMAAAALVCMAACVCVLRQLSAMEGLWSAGSALAQIPLQVLLFGSLAVGLSVLGHLSIVGGVIAFPVMAACTYCCVSDLLEG